jgi:hypothetical protein
VQSCAQSAFDQSGRRRLRPQFAFNHHGSTVFKVLRAAGLMLAALLPRAAHAQAEQALDVPTRAGVTNRILLQAPLQPRAVVLLYAGGHGGLQIQADGSMRWGEGSFVVRTRRLFVEQGLAAAVIDAPSDRQQPPFLNRFRQTAEHAQDAAAIITELRKRLAVPVWLVGTSRGTQSVAAIALQLSDQAGAPDGLVLTSSILRDPGGRPLPAMALEKLRLAVLVVHHRQDGCEHCRYADLPQLMDKLATSRKELLSFSGGTSQGDPCEARAHHGFNGIEPQVVTAIARWIHGS